VVSFYSVSGLLRTGWIGAWIPEPEITTPAGTRQAFSLYAKPTQLEWDRGALRGLTKITTDCRPLKYWLRVISRAEEDECECGVAQNTAHILECTLEGGGSGRMAEEARRDPEWYREVAGFLRSWFYRCIEKATWGAGTSPDIGNPTSRCGLTS